MPPDLKNQDDDVILPSLLSKDAPLVTLDFEIVFDYPELISPGNPGIIIIKARPNKATIVAKALSLCVRGHKML
jgi:hypothetical protein